MDLIEILFIAFFILFPVMEGILRQRRKGQDRGQEEAESPLEREPGEREPRSASDMLPDDLWEMMTGERRGGGSGEEDEPWSSTPEKASAPTVPAESEPEPESAWEPEPWRMDDEAEVPAPRSLEYEGPEAYSLETPAPEPETLEGPLQRAAARHRAFHRMIDEPVVSKPRVATPLMRALNSRDGLRRAVILKEVLGPPKGLP